jgi:hypothetical protein
MAAADELQSRILPQQLQTPAELPPAPVRESLPPAEPEIKAPVGISTNTSSPKVFDLQTRLVWFYNEMSKNRMFDLARSRLVRLKVGAGGKPDGKWGPNSQAAFASFAALLAKVDASGAPSNTFVGAIGAAGTSTDKSGRLADALISYKGLLTPYDVTAFIAAVKRMPEADDAAKKQASSDKGDATAAKAAAPPVPPVDFPASLLSSYGVATKNVYRLISGDISGTAINAFTSSSFTDITSRMQAMKWCCLLNKAYAEYQGARPDDKEDCIFLPKLFQQVTERSSKPSGEQLKKFMSALATVGGSPNLKITSADKKFIRAAVPKYTAAYPSWSSGLESPQYGGDLVKAKV